MPSWIDVPTKGALAASVDMRVAACHRMAENGPSRNDNAEAYAYAAMLHKSGETIAKSYRL